MSVSFRNIHPLIRFAGKVTFCKGTPPLARVAYDQRLFFLLSERADFIIGGQRVEVKRGDLLLLLSGTPYTILANEGDTSLFSINFVFFSSGIHGTDLIPLSSPDRFRRELQSETVVFEEGFLSDGWIRLPACADLLPLLQALVQEAEHGDALSQSQMRSYLTLCLDDAFRRWRADATLPHRSASTQNELLAWLDRHYTENPTNREIAARFHYHPNYVSQLIRALTGQPLHRYLLTLKIRRASDLLLHLTHDRRNTVLHHRIPDFLYSLYNVNCPYYSSPFSNKNE